MTTHQLRNDRPGSSHDLHTDDIRLLFVQGETKGLSQTVIHHPLLEKNDAIQLIRYTGKTQPSWQAPVSSVVTLTAISGPVTLNLIPQVGDTRTILLDRFQTVIVWPGAAYRISSQGSDGTLLRMQRDLRSASAGTDQGPPPASGYLLPPSQCGADIDGIRNLIPPNEVPGFELKLAKGFTENEPHYHRTFGEAYIVASGTIITSLTCIATRQSHTQELRMGDCVVIPPNTVHHVIGGSEDNQIIVAYWPRFRGTKGEDWNPAS